MKNKKTLDEIAGIDKLEKQKDTIPKMTGNEIDNSVINEYLEMVKEFHETFGVAVRNSPEKATKKDLVLRINLLQEELDELKDSPNEDLNELFINVLDALCDLQYVLSGSVLQLGFSDVFDEAFRAVHESNMSKVITDRHSVDTELYLYSKDGTPCTSRKVDGGWVIVRLSDGKILKPTTYKPVDLSKFI